MNSNVNSVSLEYGDANITFFNVQIPMAQEHMVWHSHSYYEIHIGTKTHDYVFPDQTIHLRSGEMLIIPPKLLHKPISDSDRANTIVVSILITPTEGVNKFYDTFTAALNQNALKPLLIPNIDKSKLMLFSQNQLYHSLLGVCKLKAVASDFICQLFCQIIQEDTVSVYSKNEISVLLNELVNISGITLDDIAAATHYSKRHVARLIKKQYSVSLTKLQQDKKKELLDERENS